MRRLAILLLVPLSFAVASTAAQLTLSLPDVEEAIRVGQTRVAADRARFHAPYRVSVSQAPVDFVDVVTPFRRVVIAADERARLGDRSFGQRQAIDLLTAARARFDVVVELTFHPLNTFVTMPNYDVVLVRDGARITPATIDRRPRFGARVDALPPSVPTPAGLIRSRDSQPLLGGTLIAQVDGESLDHADVVDVIVRDGDKELATARIDLGRLR